MIIFGSLGIVHHYLGFVLILKDSSYKYQVEAVGTYSPRNANLYLEIKGLKGSMLCADLCVMLQPRFYRIQ